MKNFKINKNLEIVCEWKKTRNAFKHVATLLKKGNEIADTKICYVNRTWESFEFESVITKLLDEINILTDNQKKKFLVKISGKVKEEINSEFNSVAMIAAMGNIFGQTKKEKNDWKTRMIKAGLGHLGLIIPDDWNSLTELEKEKRLNNVIKGLKTKVV